jgi:5'-deoxynucleotidase YfbR-like HD superfamily hydrolase
VKGNGETVTWIQTLNGKRFNLDRPNADAIDPHTLAVCLARKCRFGGHCRDFYSVAQHSLLVCDLTPSPSLKLAALLHDAHEAYSGFGDVLRPAKHLWADTHERLRCHEIAVDLAIAKRFKINPEWLAHPAIKHNDNVALATEARDLMEEPPCPWESLPSPHFEIIEPLGIDEAYRRFMARLYELWGE